MAQHLACPVCTGEMGPAWLSLAGRGFVLKHSLATYEAHLLNNKEQIIKQCPYKRCYDRPGTV